MRANQILVLLVFAVLSFTAHSQTKTAEKMNNETIEKFQIVGISTRTTNANGQAPQDIEALWARFWGEEITKQIPNKVSDEIYAVYTEYETDYTGAYTMIIGLPVSSLDNIPEGFVGITIEKDVYEKFVSRGKMPEAILNTWVEIWKNKELKRAYRFDFTVHGEKYFNGDNAEVETFISVRE